MCVVHGYIETASVMAVLNDVDRSSDDIVGLPLYGTQFKVGSTTESKAVINLRNLTETGFRFLGFMQSICRI